jgi:hypothetical protein
LTLELLGRDVFLRHTGTDGKSYVQQHRCWDAERFLTAQQRAARDVNDKEKSPDTQRARVELITEAQYHQERRA